VRLNITLDDEYAEKLARIAERTHVQPGTVARSLLSTALDAAAASSSFWTGSRARVSARGSGARRPRRAKRFR
jgi:hypothetical protein